ncbi:MAG: membrane protein insertase YidC [Gammaproteobacteria bacterium]|nr:membrane protein insertase YidC [Gammaproteobacteria bacterium]
MDTVRFILVITFIMVSMKLWTTWETTYGTDQQTQTQELSQQQPPGILTNEMPEFTEPQTQDAPALPREETSAPNSVINIETDIFQVVINTQGAGITQAAMLDFPVSLEEPDNPLVLLEDSLDTTFVIQGGLLSEQDSPTQQSFYTSERDRYVMADDQNVLRVPFQWQENGVVVTKTYEFTRGSHLVRVYYSVTNNSQQPWRGRSYAQIKRNDPDQGGMRFIYTYTGTVISSPENRYEKIAFDDIEESPLSAQISNGWIAVIQHYFLAGLVPSSPEDPYHYYTKSLGNKLYTSGLISPGREILPGQEAEFLEQVYIGPKDQEILAGIAEGLDLTVDYGMLWFLSKPLFWALKAIHEKIGNWGWSIIIVTMILKLLFYRLSAAGYRSMANMRRVQPRLMSLKERYKDDRVKMNQAMMQIYKEEKINPFGGCFPILVQIPVFIALYWVLLESVELRQAGFMLWIDDLSRPDPYWVLPLIMGVTMFVHQKLNPAPMDPVQAKVMMTLPVVFTVFFGFFPSGLVLYWVANNSLSILQQWRIMKNLEKAGLGHKSN